MTKSRHGLSLCGVAFWSLALACAGCMALVEPKPAPPPAPTPAPTPAPACGQVVLAPPVHPVDDVVPARPADGRPPREVNADGRPPRELNKVSHPDYVIEPPDVVRIDALRVVPRPPYRIQPLDAISIQVTDTLPEAPIAGVYVVDPDGLVNLGFSYGPVSVANLSLEQARKAIEQYLKRSLKAGYQVTVTLAQSRGLQQIRGDHLVHQDGKVILGIYGSVRVVGLTLEMAKAAIEDHLSRYLLDPEIALDISGFNSKVYYIVIDGGGQGEQVFRLPITGNETVLDALAQIYGLPAVSSKDRIWVSRPTPGDADQLQVLPVDWRAVVQGGATRTNYQLLPGDRIYVKALPLVRTDNFLARLFAPVERILGITLLGSTTVNSIKGTNGGLGTGR